MPSVVARAERRQVHRLSGVTHDDLVLSPHRHLPCHRAYALTLHPLRPPGARRGAQGQASLQRRLGRPWGHRATLNLFARRPHPQCARATAPRTPERRTCYPLRSLGIPRRHASTRQHAHADTRAPPPRACQPSHVPSQPLPLLSLSAQSAARWGFSAFATGRSSSLALHATSGYAMLSCMVFSTTT